MGEGKKLQIRNSTVDFLVFTKDAGENGIEVRVQEDTVWLTQKAIGQLFDIGRSVVTKSYHASYPAVRFFDTSVTKPDSTVGKALTSSPILPHL